MALLRSLDALGQRALELTGVAAADLAGERLDGLMQQLHLRDLLLQEIGDVLARVSEARAKPATGAGSAWTDAAETEWNRVASRLEELGQAEAELAGNLLTAREAIASELSKLGAARDTVSPYRHGPRPPQIDRRG